MLAETCSFYHLLININSIYIVLLTVPYLLISDAIGGVSHTPMSLQPGCCVCMYVCVCVCVCVKVSVRFEGDIGDITYPLS